MNLFLKLQKKPLKKRLKYFRKYTQFSKEWYNSKSKKNINQEFYIKNKKNIKKKINSINIKLSKIK